jgi:8-oxo-dGTP pyrophosphatase MutT (NUDIX family)
MITVVICSVDAEKFARASASYAARLAGTPHEIVGIHDAQSLAEGYTRGFARSRGDLMVFSHDDVIIASDDFAGALVRALAQVDVVGVAGTTRVVGAYWPAAGHPHLRGWVTVPIRDGGYSVNIYGIDAAVSTGLQGIDGCLFAARREVVENVGFDADTFDAFHGYDLDFSFSAHRAGHRIGTSAEIVAIHASTGAFDDAWKVYADRFEAKHRDALPAGFTPAPWQLARIRVRDTAAIVAQFPLSRLMDITAKLRAGG